MATAWASRQNQSGRKTVRRWVLSSLVAVSLALPAASVTCAESGSLSPEEVSRVLAYGFDVISERSLEPSTPRSLALEGLRSLGALDPDLAITVNGNDVVLTTTQREVLRVPTPSPQDSDAWAAASNRILAAARSVSSAIGEASDEDLLQSIFDGALSELDTFSRYAGRLEAEEHRAKRYGFGGIGIRFRLERSRLSIFEVVSKSPAETAGLRPGDAIVRINGEDIAALSESNPDPHTRPRIPASGFVTLTIEREGALRDITIRRETVVAHSVSLESVADGIARIRIESFNQGTVRTVIEALERARTESSLPLEGIVLDLRGNPGGLLEQAVGVADLFITRGRIVSTRGRHPEAVQLYMAMPDDIAAGLPMIVLMDGRSASAAEILGAALQDSGRAVVVGSTSYGKGTVQTVLRLPNDGEITLTWSRFLSPSGYALHGLGVMPTVCTSSPDESLAEALRPIRDGDGAIATRFSLWRTTPLEDKEGRHALRSICPPKGHTDWEIDEGVARRLLADPALYAKALSLSLSKSVGRW